jgi:hypothetical protein
MDEHHFDISNFDGLISFLLLSRYKSTILADPKSRGCTSSQWSLGHNSWHRSCLALAAGEICRHGFSPWFSLLRNKGFVLEISP